MSRLNSIGVIKAFLNAENKRDWSIWSSYVHSDIEHEVVGNEKAIKGKDNYIANVNYPPLKWRALTN